MQELERKQPSVEPLKIPVARTSLIDLNAPAHPTAQKHASQLTSVLNKVRPRLNVHSIISVLEEQGLDGE